MHCIPAAPDAHGCTYKRPPIYVLSCVHIHMNPLLYEYLSLSVYIYIDTHQLRFSSQPRLGCFLALSGWSTFCSHLLPHRLTLAQLRIPHLTCGVSFRQRLASLNDLVVGSLLPHLSVLYHARCYPRSPYVPATPRGPVRGGTQPGRQGALSEKVACRRAM